MWRYRATMTREELAHEVHALYVQQAKLHGWRIVDGPLEKLPADLQAMHYALADLVLEKIEAVRKAVASQSVASNPALIADVLEAVAEALRQEAKPVPATQPTTVVEKSKNDRNDRIAPRFEV